MRFTCCQHIHTADCLPIACYSSQDVSPRVVEPPRLRSGRAALWMQHRGHKGIHDCMQSCSGGGAGCGYCTSRASDSFFLFSFRFIFSVCLPIHFFGLPIGAYDSSIHSGVYRRTEEQKNRSTYDMSILRIQMGTKGRESEGVS